MGKDVHFLNLLILIFTLIRDQYYENVINMHITQK